MNMPSNFAKKVPVEPFTGFYESVFKLLLYYPYIKTIQTDNCLLGSKNKNYMDLFFSNWKLYHQTLSIDKKERQEQFKKLPNQANEFF